MKVSYGKGATEFGTGVLIDLDADEVAMAIDLYIYSKEVYISGSRTTTIGGELTKPAHVYVDPSGFVISDGERFSGNKQTNRTK